MTMPALLVASGRNVATATPYRLVGGSSLSAIGTPPGAPLDTVLDDNAPYVNHVAQFKNKLFWVQHSNCYEYNEGAGTWGMVFNGGTVSLYTGLYAMVNASGDPVLVYAYRSGPSTTSVATYDGTSWSSAVVGTSGNEWYASAKLYNILWWVEYDGDRIDFYDPKTAAHSRVFQGNKQSCRFFSGFQGRVFHTCFTANTVGANLRLREVVGGVYNFVHDFGSTCRVSAAEYDTAGPLAFSDGDGFYCLGVGRMEDAGQDPAVGTFNAIGTVLYKLTPRGSAFSQTILNDVGNTVLPGEWKPGGAYGGGGNHWRVLVDQNTDPLNPAIYLGVRNTEVGGSWWFYKWNGPTSAMTLEGSGVAANGLYVPNVPFGGGERWWTSGDLDIDIVARTSTIGGMHYSFVAYGDPGNADKYVRFYANSDLGIPSEQIPMFGTATGGSAVRVGNEVQGVDADGSTVYTTKLDLSAVDMPPGALGHIMARVSFS